ncbi:MAG: dTDP-4-dehydrorhamnose 3,5-epimerase [Acidimicrobiia bacterium]
MNGLLLFRSRVIHDDRGYFWETQHRERFAAIPGLDVDFVQENQSFSRPHVLRGLHYQLESPQGKLVRVAAGQVFDVAVDLRGSSPSLGQWFGVHLSGGDGMQLWIPPGFAHGFFVTSPEGAYLDYSLTSYYNPATERTVRWNDPTIGIDWPLREKDPIVSKKDRLGLAFEEADLFP